MADKKQRIPLEWVNVIFFIFIIILVAIIYGIKDKIHAALVLVILWIIMAILVIILKAIVLSGDREINSTEVVDICISSFLSTLLIIGSTMMSINYIPIVGRAFENTVGYSWINNDNLSNALNEVFNKSDANQNINLIATQLFYDNKDDIDKYIEEFKNSPKFAGVAVKENFDTNKLNEILLKKKNISEVTLISLATIGAFFTSYLPITNPWMFNNN
jgi:hypothetical protein